MPWHLRSVRFDCKVCGRRASYELYNRYNAPSGYYCGKCGNEAVKRFEKEEERYEQLKKEGGQR